MYQKTIFVCFWPLLYEINVFESIIRELPIISKGIFSIIIHAVVLYIVIFIKQRGFPLFFFSSQCHSIKLRVLSRCGIVKSEACYVSHFWLAVLLLFLFFYR